MNRTTSELPRMLTTALALAMFAGLATAQTGQASPGRTETGSALRTTGSPQRDTLTRMMKPITIAFNETRLEDAVVFIQQVTGADLEIFWADDRNAIGLDKEMSITLPEHRGTALALLEKVLERAQAGAIGGGGNTWQLSTSGAMQVGPKERLNAYRRVELYPINDLLLEIPDYGNAPEFDLQSVLQQGGQQGGGSGQSPFRNDNQDPPDRRPIGERADEIIQLLTQLVEPEQWEENGGSGGSIRFFQGSLIVNAPDYMHRQLNGYPYWPSRATRFAMAKDGRRYVTLGVDTAIGTLNDIRNVPVTGVVPGQQGPGGGGTPGGGGGGGGGGPRGPG